MKFSRKASFEWSYDRISLMLHTVCDRNNFENINGMSHHISFIRFRLICKSLSRQVFLFLIKKKWGRWKMFLFPSFSFSNLSCDYILISKTATSLHCWDVRDPITICNCLFQRVSYLVNKVYQWYKLVIDWKDYHTQIRSWIF